MQISLSVTPADIAAVGKAHQIRRYPWRCWVCFRLLWSGCIVGIAEDGSQQTFCGECGERMAQALRQEAL